MTYSNDQWKVDDDGIVGVDGTDGHLFSELLLTMEVNEKTYYQLPIQMALRSYVDIELFIAAWVSALDKFALKIPTNLSAEILDRTLLEARSTEVLSK